MIKEAIIKLSKKEDLSIAEAKGAMEEIMNGEASAVQMSAYLCLLSAKGESIEEITASAEVLREHCIRILHQKEVLEIVGTGGDLSNSFNISTASSLVVSSAGIPVAKHGNRASSSKCGSADVLEALGVNLFTPPQRSKEILDEINLCFLFAQNHHLSMKYVAPIRKELGIKSIFNLLGPLLNPAGASMELMGVYDCSLVEPLAVVMKNLGVKSGMVVFGKDGLDEISLSSETQICEIKDGEILSYCIKPEDFGLKRCQKADLQGGDSAYNAKIIWKILKGELRGAKRDAVCLNSGAALYIAKDVKNIKEGIEKAQALLDSGKALAQLEKFIQKSHL